MTVLWQRADILADSRDRINYDEIRALCDEKRAALHRPVWHELQSELAQLPTGETLSTRGVDLSVLLDRDEVTIGTSSDLTSDELEKLRRCIELLIPWRKGPYRLFGEEIDSEWRSNRKWDRIAPYLDPLEGRQVADIGCSSGYYMFRASAQNPRFILGIDPSEKFFYCFELMQRFLQNPRLQYEMLGVEHMPMFQKTFDVVFCLGILYHHRSPLDLLRGILQSMKPGAQLIVESQAIPGSEPVALCPPGRYAKARNVHFVPTAACLESWLQSSGFREIEVISSVEVGFDEQRTTRLMPFESLKDFLDPSDSRKTIEGYPAPLRVALRARAPY